MQKIILNSNKILRKINNVDLYKGESNADYLYILIPQTYNEIDLATCSIIMHYITPDEKEHYFLLDDYKQEELEKEHFVYKVDLTSIFTSIVGSLPIYLTILQSDTTTILKTSETHIIVNDTNDDAQATQEEITVISQLVLKYDEFEKYVEDTVSEYNEQVELSVNRSTQAIRTANEALENSEKALETSTSALTISQSAEVSSNKALEVANKLNNGYEDIDTHIEEAISTIVTEKDNAKKEISDDKDSAIVNIIEEKNTAIDLIDEELIDVLDNISKAEQNGIANIETTINSSIGSIEEKETEVLLGINNIVETDITSINTATATNIDRINTEKDNAIVEINANVEVINNIADEVKTLSEEAETTLQKAHEDANSAIETMNTVGEQQIGSINSAGANQIESINTTATDQKSEITDLKNGALTEISEKKTESISAINEVETSAINSVETKGVEVVTSIEDASVQIETNKNNIEEIETELEEAVFMDEEADAELGDDLIKFATKAEVDEIGDDVNDIKENLDDLKNIHTKKHTLIGKTYSDSTSQWQDTPFQGYRTCINPIINLSKITIMCFASVSTSVNIEILDKDLNVLYNSINNAIQKQKPTPIDVIIDKFEGIEDFGYVQIYSTDGANIGYVPCSADNNIIYPADSEHVGSYYNGTSWVKLSVSNSVRFTIEMEFYSTEYIQQHFVNYENTLSNRKFVLFGDSITEGDYGYEDGLDFTYGIGSIDSDTHPNIKEKNYPYFMTENLSLTNVENRGMCGADAIHMYFDQVEQQTDNTGIDVAIFMIGTNRGLDGDFDTDVDITSSANCNRNTQVGSYAKSMLEILEKNNFRTRVFMCMPILQGRDADFDKQTLFIKNTYKLASIFSVYGVKLIDTRNLCGITEDNMSEYLNTTDKTHPNEKGYKLLADAITQGIINNY